MGQDEVLFHALTDELITTPTNTPQGEQRRALLKERLDQVIERMRSSGELRGLIERAEAREARRLKEMPYLPSLLFEALTR
jgi:hypothetical protein